MRHPTRLTVAAGLLVLAALAHADGATVLWYDKPAVDWEKEALPIGNGRIGAMVFGGVDSERLQISEKSLWTGGPGTEGGYDFGLPAESQAGLMRSIGKQLLEGAQLKPKRWRSSSAARCKTTATTRASATSSSSVKPMAQR
jgi:alpha-L-fucosidase 2